MAIIAYMRDVLGEEPIFDPLANSQIYKLLTIIYMIYGLNFVGMINLLGFLLQIWRGGWGS